MTRANKWWGVTPALVTATVVAWFMASGSWRLVGIWPLPARYVTDAPATLTSFADLAYLTAVADCMDQGVDFTVCDPYQRPFQPYGVVPGSLLNVLGIGLTDTGWLGTALAVTWVVLIGVLGVAIAARWRGAPAGLVAGLAALTVVGMSPPALLGIERGQIEVVIIALTGLGLGLVSSAARPIASIAGALALFTTVVLKYLSIGALVAFLAPVRWRFWGLMAGAASMVFLALNLSDLEIARETARADLVSTTRGSFSSTTSIVSLLVADPLAFTVPPDQVIDEGSVRLGGAAIFLILMLLWWVILRRTSIPIQVRALPDVTWNLIIGGGFVLIVPFFLGASHDYRLMFLALPLTGLLLWLGQPGVSPAIWVMVALVTVATVPAASMIPNDANFIMPEPVVVIGDLAATALLAGIASLYIFGWSRGSNSAQVANSEG
jgi:hypothetical protein